MEPVSGVVLSYRGSEGGMLAGLTCQLTREDRFSTIRRFSVRMGGGFRLKGSVHVKYE